MISLTERLLQGKVVVADGGLGTELIERGLAPGSCPENLNLSNPQILSAIASAYLEAGAEILETNTFGGSPLKLSDFGLEKQMAEINARGVEIVKEVAGDRAYVSASVGPSGKILEPYGEVASDAVFESFERQIRSLIGAGADIICIETMMDLREATLAVAAAKAVSAKTPVMVTMTFEKTPRGFFTMMGSTIPQAVLALAEAGADIVGSNCGNGIDAMIEIAREFRARTKLPLLIQSNAGVPNTWGGKVVYPEGADLFGSKVSELIAAGVNIIGGCCGTTPAHIRAMKQAVSLEKR